MNHLFVDPETGLEYEPLPEEREAQTRAERNALLARFDVLWGRGLTMRQIAQELGLSERTVSRLAKETRR